MTAVGLVVFDLDGTLVDSAGDLAAAMNATIGRLVPGTPPLPPLTVRSFVGEGARVLVERSLAAVGLPHDPASVLPLFLDAYRERLLDTTVPYPGVAEALARLGPRRLAVLTNKPGDMSRGILQGLGLAGLFMRIWGGRDLPEKKPHPGGLLRLLDECGLPPEAAVMVGDSWIDVRTGRAAGARTAGVAYGYGRETLRAEPPDVLLNDLRELPAWLDRLASGPAAPVLP